MIKFILVISSLAFSSSSALAASGFEFSNRSGQGSYKKFDDSNFSEHSIEFFDGGTSGRFCRTSFGFNRNCGSLSFDYSGEFGTIQGIWTNGNQRGTFVWSFSDSNNFSGSFKFNNDLQPDPASGNIYFPSDGEWNGTVN